MFERVLVDAALREHLRRTAEIDTLAPRLPVSDVAQRSRPQVGWWRRASRTVLPRRPHRVPAPASPRPATPALGKS